MKPPKPLPRLSAKKIKALKGKPIPFSSVSKRSGIKRKKRSKSEFARIYHSKERVEFVKSLPCAACGVVGYSENAHVAGESGVAYKADAEFIAPLCGPRNDPRGWYPGCHRLLHDWGRETFQRHFPNFDADTAVSATEWAWENRR